jgi:hypothetical protein
MLVARPAWMTPAIAPHPYAFGARDEPIGLYAGRAKLLQGRSAPLEGQATVSLVWVPSPRISFELVADSVGLAELDEAELKLIDLPDDHQVHVRVGHADLAGGQVGGMFLEPLSSGSGPVDSVDFLLANTPAMSGDWINDREGHGGWRGRVDLEDLPWRIRLEPRRDHSELIRGLQAMGGYAATHQGRIDRVDGCSFTIEEAEELMHGLDYFLSFARGFWTPPLLPVGYDQRKLVWRRWLNPRSSEWHANFSWFSLGTPTR